MKKNNEITSNDLSIVIPCKNEKNNIIETIDSIYKQKFINIDIIIADNSDDNITLKLIEDNRKKYENKLNIIIIKGGLPSEGRSNGSKLIKSKYILFLDADIKLIYEDSLINLYNEIKNKNMDLLTVTFKTDIGFNYIYKLFYIIQIIAKQFNIIFALGGFQLWNNEIYNKIGGYNPDILFAEDYWISSKVNKNKFIINNKFKAYTSARRFKNKGIYYMIKMMILSYLNRKNIEFYKKDHNYWK